MNHRAPTPPLTERTIYIPRMNYGSAFLMAAAFRSVGVKAEVLPESTPDSLRLAGAHMSGDECLPQRVTLAGILQVINQPGFDPARVAFLMATAHGPCRFGQYSTFFRKIFNNLNCSEMMIVSPTTRDGYGEFGISDDGFIRTAWRALVIGDVLLRMLLKTRPYEQIAGETDGLYADALQRVSDVLAVPGCSHSHRMSQLVDTLTEIRDSFRRLPLKAPPACRNDTLRPARLTECEDAGGRAGTGSKPRSRGKPLIGAVGEIYCRLDSASNDEIIRQIEAHGGEVWLAGIVEWLEYTNDEVMQNFRTNGKSFSLERAGFALRQFIQRKDEHALVHLFEDDLRGYEEARIGEILRRSEPYIPSYATLGEMVINTGRAVFLYEKGVDGIVDISPFTCMNGIVCESVYPKLSRDHDDIPIKVFYFDGKARDWSQDVEMFMELVKDYRTRKRAQRNGKMLR